MNNLRKQAFNQSRFQNQAPSGSALKIQQALDLHLAGDFGPAATLYGEVLKEEPENFDALHLLGMAAHQTGDHQGALAMVDKALAVRPDAADALSNRSAILMELGLPERALESCTRSLQLNSSNPEAYFNAGNALAKLGRRQEAVEQYHLALSIRPDFPVCLTNMAGELIELGQLQDAANLVERALELEPTHRKAWLNLGVALQEAGQNKEAAQAYEKALSIDGSYERAYVNLATLHLNMGNLTQALKFVEAGLSVNADSGDLHNCAGNCLRALGEPARASEHYRRALVSQPKTSNYYSNLLLTMLGDPAVEPEQICDEALRFGSLHGVSNSTTNTPEGPLRRIGFLSGDMRSHPVGYFLETLLKGLTGVETILYANQPSNDEQSEVLANLATEWRTVYALNDDQLSDLIAQDRVDVLIDCSGHTAGGRLGAVSRKLAPVQLSWLGYSGTTGIDQFDGLLGDNVVTPRQNENLYSEDIVRLPDTFAPFFKPSDLPPVNDLPFEKNGSITFGSFNAISKLNDAVLAAWAQILNRVPDSNLLVKSLYAIDPTVQARIIETMTAYGVDSTRIRLLGQTPRADHLDALSSVDFALDPFPYSGATTTVDCLWAGVPVLTLLGQHYAGRMSASFLKQVGLDDWICSSTEEYIEKACRFAQDPVTLAQIRKGLRIRMESSPASQPSAFAAGFLRAVSRVWSSAPRVAA